MSVHVQFDLPDPLYRALAKIATEDQTTVKHLLTALGAHYVNTRLPGGVPPRIVTPRPERRDRGLVRFGQAARRTPEQRERIIRLIGEGMTQTEIAKEFNIDRNTLSTDMVAMGIPRLPKGHRTGRPSPR